MTTKLKILFLCTGNSCRSQMAEGWARRLKGAAIEPYSAGIEARGLDARAVKVMAEAGVDISRQRSKTLSELKEVSFDFVVTLCDHAHEGCPLSPGKAKVVHVGFDDPPRLAQDARTEEEALGHYRRVRYEIRAFVERLPETLTGAVPAQKTRVLFLCTGNSCRSQMAEAFLRKYGGDRFEPHSAGLAPQPVHPLAVRVMQEAGVDISRQRSKSVREYLGKVYFHHLIVVCEQANRNCPTTFPRIGDRQFSPFQDPTSFAGTDDEKLAKFREVRDQIEAWIKAWIKNQR
jgi:arsenate reductase